MASELHRVLPIDLTVFLGCSLRNLYGRFGETRCINLRATKATTGNVRGFSQLIQNQATTAPFRILSDPLLNTQPTIPRCVVPFRNGVVIEGSGLTVNEHSVTVQIITILRL